MSPRAVILGLLGAVVICGITYFNDAVMHNRGMIGNFMPTGVYGLLILFVLTLNPLMFKIWKRLSFSGAELAVILTIVLAACSVPSGGLMRTFTISLVMPYHSQRSRPAWQEQKVIEKVPRYMLADVTKENDTEVVSGFVQGKGSGDKHIKLSQVPWYAWTRTISFWMPAIVLFWIAMIGMALVVHKQWADHEQLPYPIAAFTNSLLPNASQAISDVLRNRLFWYGMIPVLLIGVNNYAFSYFPKLMQIPLGISLASLRPLFPVLARAEVPSIWAPSIVFTALAFAYFLPSEVSLSLGIAPYVQALLIGTLVGYGISIDNGSDIAFVHGNISSTAGMVMGAYIGILLMLLYTGRHYYLGVLISAFRIRKAEGVEVTSVAGARAFILAMAALTVYLSTIGQMDWQLTILFLGLLTAIFVVMSRVVAETGLFFVTQHYFLPVALFMGFLGAKAFGPMALIMTFMFTLMLAPDTREALMPFVSNSLKLLDMRKVPIRKIAPIILIALLIGVAVAIPVTLYFQYDRGSDTMGGWETWWVPVIPFQEMSNITQRLAPDNAATQALDIHGWARFANLSPSPTMVATFAAGLVLVLLFSVARLRWTKWPLHPVLFLVWFTGPGSTLASSFMLGWLVKVLITKYGGGSVYRTIKPVMIGLIAGEMTSGVISMIIGATYYFVTGEMPKGR